MRVIARDNARALGLRRYFTGRVCKRGHLAERYVINGGCVDCLNPPAMPLAPPGCHAIAVTINVPIGLTGQPAELLAIELQRHATAWLTAFGEKPRLETRIFHTRFYHARTLNGRRLWLPREPFSYSTPRTIPQAARDAAWVLGWNDPCDQCQWVYMTAEQEKEVDNGTGPGPLAPVGALPFDYSEAKRRREEWAINPDGYT